MLRIVFLSTLLFFLLGHSAPLSACSCVPTTPQRMLENHALIFRGIVESVEIPDSSTPFARGKARFKVETLYKGEASGQTIEVSFNASSGASCGTSFTVGATEMVFTVYSTVGPQKPVYSTGLCSMSPFRSNPLRYQPALDAYRLAVADASKAVEAHPDSTQAWLALAHLQESHRDHIPLTRNLGRLRELAPGDATHATRQGNAFLALKRFDEALAAYDFALKLAPDDEQAKRGREQSLIKLGRVLELDPARKDFSSMELNNVDFSKRDLSDAKFVKARLQAARFAGARLDRADFSAAHFSGGDLTVSESRATRFDGTYFSGTDLSGSNLAGASFARANLLRTRISEADLSNVDFSQANLESTSVARSKLKGASFKGARMIHADFSATDLSGQDLGGLEMQGISLRNASLVNANLSGSLLAGPTKAFRSNERLHGPGKAADLRGTDLTGADLRDADIRFALFDCRTKWPSGIDLAALLLIPITSKDCPGPPRRTRLFERPGELREMPGLIGGERASTRGPELEGLDLTGVDLSGANLSGFRLWSVLLRDAALRAVDLRHANLGGSDFRGADLTGADFSGAHLHGADLSGARLGKVRMTGTRYNERTRWPEGFDPQAAGAQPDVVRHRPAPIRPAN